ncbi:MAG: hypothetical protein MUF49_05295 [Oculatellaceae cyanobacterium Prado106]|nr:hypothetical protein [Oculatellaceae cyanobacterium Prado106]
MAIARFFLPLLILLSLGLLVWQNWSPSMPLVVLGLQTQALPLALWIGGAIAAGAATTLVVSALFGLSRFSAVRRSSATGAKRPTNARVTEGRQRPWTNWGAERDRPQPINTPSGRSADRINPPSNNTRFQDDWEASPREEWDDWEDPQTAHQTPHQTPSRSSQRPPQTEVRDRLDEDWENWEGFDENLPQDRVRSSTEERRAPRRTDFETRREPVTRQQSGSVYSYSYKDPDSPRDKPESSKQSGQPSDPQEVYDADFRVIVPPYQSDYQPDYQPDYQAEPAPPPSNPSINADDDEDWGFDDDELEEARRK